MMVTNSLITFTSLSSRPTVEGDTVMPRITYFVQTCPTCGRRLQVRVEYLGKSVRCQHCSASFSACDPTIADEFGSEKTDPLLARADRLLASADDWGLSTDGF